VQYTVPDDQVALTVDVTPWLDAKIDAILAHQSEVHRGALPGLVATLAPNARAELLSTEWYLSWEPASHGALGTYATTSGYSPVAPSMRSRSRSA
jgi:N-acetyl-1-D-myo-inositol-2-amino-2-deoxy-alpha-D-glucopyranoside deacetylase